MIEVHEMVVDRGGSGIGSGVLVGQGTRQGTKIYSIKMMIRIFMFYCKRRQS